jgi:hypothetical protein
MNHPIKLRGDSNFWIRRMLSYRKEPNGWPYWESIMIFHETGRFVYPSTQFKIVLDLY